VSQLTIAFALQQSIWRAYRRSPLVQSRWLIVPFKHVHGQLASTGRIRIALRPQGATDPAQKSTRLPLAWVALRVYD
jgi:hypothetical protein